MPCNDDFGKWNWQVRQKRLVTFQRGFTKLTLFVIKNKLALHRWQHLGRMFLYHAGVNCLQMGMLEASMTEVTVLLLSTITILATVACIYLLLCFGRNFLFIRERRRQIISDGRGVTYELECVGSGCHQRDTLSLLVVLGSGGHTAEMLTLIHDVVSTLTKNVHITYAYGMTDKYSQAKAAKMHLTTNCQEGFRQVTEAFEPLPRAREVGQSWTSTVWTSLMASVAAAKLIWVVRPHVVLTNGPGTSAIVGAISFCLRTIQPKRFSCQVVYVESFARVETLSMSGRLMYLFADRFIVQWSQLQERWPLSECYGRLC